MNRLKLWLANEDNQTFLGAILLFAMLIGFSAAWCIGIERAFQP